MTRCIDRVESASGLENTGFGKTGDFAGIDILEHEVIDAVPVPCFLVGGDGDFRAGNTAFYELVKNSRSRFIDHGLYELLAPDNASQLQTIDRRLYERGGVVSHEGKIVLGDGRVRPVAYKKAVVHGREGEKLGVMVTILDLSELDAAKVALHASESEKQAILDSFPGILLLFDADEKVLWVNERVRELHSDPVGKGCCEIFHCQQEACAICTGPGDIASGNVGKTVRQIEMQTPDGEDRVYEMSGTPVKNNNGELTSIVVIGRDVTENSKLEKQLRHTQKMEAIGTLAGGIAHDFNNVLTPIMGYSEIIRLKMRQDGMQDQTINNYLEEILLAAKRAKSLVEQILTYSRSNEQREILQYIHPIVKEVMKLMRVTLPSTIVIREEIDEQCGLVSIDPVQIHQILINLCTNSSHAMADGHGTLTVTLAEDGKDCHGQEWLRLSVADSGCGIPADMQERIFEPYFTTKEKSRGTGMGLAMVHGIISRQGGRIEVESEMGVGTTFHVLFPISQQKTRLEQVVKTGEMLRGVGRILLVDDEAQVVEVTGKLLSSLGYDVIGRTSPAEALSLFNESPDSFDLLLTDLTMPELTGVELCEKVKAVRADMPVVLFTGYSERLSRKRADAAGVDQYCVKPVSMRELAGVIYNTLIQS